MPLETATYISDLVTSNPAASDGMNATDDHLRLIKAAVKTTFPNISGQVTATHTDLNNAAAFLAGTVICKVPLGSVSAPSHTFLGDLDTGWSSPGANQLDGSVGGVRFMHVAADKTVTFDGAVNVTGVLTGPGVVPIGGMIMWLSDTLPTLGTWCWANGGTLSRTGNGAALYAITGTTYGAGDGSTTFNVINMQEAAPVGKSTMGGAASPGLLASISAGLKAVLGGVFGSDTNTLSVGNLPSHDHNVYLKDNQHRHNVPDTTEGGSAQGGPGVTPAYYSPGSNIATTFASSNITIGSVNGTANDNKTAATGSGTAVNNVTPSRAVNFIIRIG